MTISIGIRELRQHASKYIRRAQAGETVVITDRGQPVAQLTPVKSTGSSTLDRLIAEGRVTPPTGDFDEFLRTYRPPPTPPGAPSLVDEVIRARAEERD
jgi:prevent-host-death family protein